MSRTLRSLGAVALAALTVPLLGVAPAYAASSSEPAATGAYFYSLGTFDTGTPAGTPRNVTGEATDGVAAEHLAVAVRVPGQVDKQSFLLFDLATVPSDATVTKAVVTVPLAEHAMGDPRTANLQNQPAPTKVRACAAGDEGFNGNDGASLTESPTFDCKALSIEAKESADKKAYVFDISSLAATWLSGANSGIALVPTEAALAQPFQVVFLQAAKATIAVEFTPAAPEIDVAPPPLPDVYVAPTQPDFGTFNPGTPPSFVAPGPAPAPAPVPQAQAAPAAPQAPAAQLNNTVPVESLSPTTGFWLVGFLLLAALALLSLIMGDPRAAARGSTGRPSRLSQSLQAQQRAPRGAPAIRRPIGV